MFRLLTNFDKKLLPVYSEAVSQYLLETGIDVLVIEQNAYDRNGKYLGENYQSLHCRAIVDLSDFWKIFNKLQKEQS